LSGVFDKEGLELPEYTFTVEKGKIKEFAMAIGDDNPLYRDGEYAKKEGYRDIIAPPTFGIAIDMWGGPGFLGLCRWLELDPLHLLHGEQEFEYLGEINPGDEIRARVKVAQVTQREGKSGIFTLVRLETEYINQRQEKILKSVNVLVARANRERGSALDGLR